MMRSRIDRGRYELSDVDDPAVLSSVLKMWLRELEDPLIPNVRYDEALRLAARDTEEGSMGCVEFLKTIPK